MVPRRKKHIFYKAKGSNQAGELDFTYYNAVYTVENALAKVKDEKGMKRVEKFLKEGVCPDCQGTRLSKKAREPRLRGVSLPEVCRLPLTELVEWVKRRAIFSVGAHAPYGGEHLRILPHGGETPDGSWPWLSFSGPGSFHLIDGRAPAAPACRAVRNPDHRRPLCAGRAIHRSSPRQHRRPEGGDARPDRRWQLGGPGGS